jgi:hypothetical protein
MLGNESGKNRTTLPRRLWPWFVVGFLAVFFALSLTITVYVMRPSGDAVAQCKLWQYYILGMQFGGKSDVAVTALQHLLASAVGGFVLLGTAWGLGKRDKGSLNN